MLLGKDEFDEFEFTYQDKPKKVFRKGSGPGIVIMHEIPGITPQVAFFAGLVASEGFTVFMPVMFGTPGKPRSDFYIATEIARACVSKEFNCWAKRESSPITDWLRALCRHVNEQCPGRGVGAIGMCLTGGFALSLMVDEFLMAPVLSQPSLPLFGLGRHAALGISDSELEIARRRAQAGVSVLGLRFSEDKKCRKERFETLERELGPGFKAIVLNSEKDNPDKFEEDAHSVLTTELFDKDGNLPKDGHQAKDALNQVLGFFKERLLPT